jgi:hypothetical protein
MANGLLKGSRRERRVLPSNGATISMTLTPPKPFSGLAAGSVSPELAYLSNAARIPFRITASMRGGPNL